MGEQLTDVLFSTEEESNITSNNNDLVLPIAMDQPRLSIAFQEEARPHPGTDQLVCSAPHSTLHLAQMRERRRVLLTATPPLPLQATTQAGCPSLLVCPQLPRKRAASDLTVSSSEDENNLGSGTHEHTTHHYTPHMLPPETANVCVHIAPNINVSYPCEDGEVECAHNIRISLQDGESACNEITENTTPPTQQFVSGRVVSNGVT